MPAPAASTLHFTCSFQLLSTDVSPEWGDLVRIVGAWLRRNPNVGGVTNQRWFFEGGEWKGPRMPRLQIEAALHQTNDAWAWAARYEHPCRDHQFRQWRTDIGFERVSQNTYNFALSVHYWLLPGFIGEEPPRPLPTAPGIIGMLLDAHRWNVYSGSERLAATPVDVGIGDGKQVLGRLTDADRKCPVILVTRNPDDSASAVNVSNLARLVSGAAAVYSTINKEVDSELAWILPPGFEARSGSIRIYQAGLRTDSPQDNKRHRFLTRTQLDEYGESAVIEMLVRGVARRAWNSQFSRVTTVDDILYRTNEARHASLRIEADENSKEWIDLLREENASLQERLKAAQDSKDDFELLALELEDERDQLRIESEGKERQISFIRQQTADVAAELESVRQRLAVIEQFRSLPTSLLGVVNTIVGLFPTRIYFSEDALKTAEESTFNDVHIAWEIVWGTATTLHQLIFGRDISTGEIEQQFRAETGFEVSFTESKSTKANKRLMRLRKIEYAGRELEIVPHVKYGNRPPKCLRVHFAADRTDGIIVVGYCGDHLETSGTRRM